MCQLKRTLSLIMALIMVFSLLPMQVSATDAELEQTDSVAAVSNNVAETTVMDGVTIEYDPSGTLNWWEDYDLWDYNINPSGNTVTVTLKVKNNTGTGTLAAGELRFNCAPTGCDSALIGGNAAANDVSVAAVVQPGESLEIELTASKNAGISFSDFDLKEIVQTGVRIDYDTDLGSVKVDGTLISAGGYTGEIPNGGVVLTADADTEAGATFLGWVDGTTNEILSSSATYTYKSTGQTSVKAAIAAQEATAWFYAGKNNGWLFDDLNAAATFAKDQAYNDGRVNPYDYRIVTLAASGTLAKDTYNIPAGVKVLIPHSAADGGTFGTTPSYSEKKYGSSQVAFRTLNVEAGAVLNFNGSQLNVNGYVYRNNGSYTGVCTDSYGRIDLGKGAKINLNDKAYLYCYGYITGEGEVVANSGATVYEVFQLNGWRGGTITSAWEGSNETTSFAFNDYAIQNIESDFVVNFGATAGVSATVSGQFLGLQTKSISTTYIGKYVNGSGSGLLQLESGASIRRGFTPATNRMKYTFTGSAHVANINLSVNDWWGSFELNTAEYILAIPYYWDFVAEAGSTVTLHNDYKLLPGATLTAEAATADKAAAKVIVDGDLYIYDTDDYVGKGFTNSGNSVPVRYVASTGATAGSLPKMNSATPSGQVTVNGTLDINGALYVTENGGTSVDKVLKGNGVVNNYSSANAPVDTVLDEFRYNSDTKKLVDYNIRAIPVVGRIAGASTGEEYHCLAKDTYYGAGDGYWYQHVVSTDSYESIKEFKNIPVAASAAVGRQRTVTNQGKVIENVLGFVSKYMEITEEGAKIITTPFTFTVNSLVDVSTDENSTLSGKGVSTDPYVLTVTEGNTVLTSAEAVAGENEILMRYDDHLDMGNQVVEIIDAGTPESYKVGYGIEPNTVLDSAVVAMEGNYLVATGIGEATVKIDGVEKTVKVSAAPISMILLGGQSNMQGSRGEGKESIVIPEGMSYLTYGERYSMKMSNATTYAPSALAGEYRDINVVGTTSGLSKFPVNSFEAQVPTQDTYGKDGPDSGFALQWIESTGEKVWIINAAHGGSSITTWQKSRALTNDLDDNYHQAVALFKACQETMRQEIAAGHYTLSHMGFYWCQGCTDSGKSAEWYAPKFVTMYDDLKEDLRADMDSNPATPDQTLEFANIVLTVAGHMTTTGYRFEEGLYKAGDGKGFTTVEDLEMRGQRVAQLWLGANPAYPDINVVSNLVDSWVTVDGEDGVQEYFQKYYPNGRVDYVTQATVSDDWRTPTNADHVRASSSPIHYNQLGYNEMGREAVRNTMYLLGYKQDPADVETEVTFYDWTGYREVTEIGAQTKAQSSTLVVPVVYPIYRSKDVAYKVSDGLTYKYYDLTAETTMTSGTLTAIGADGDTVKVKGRELSEFRWDLDGTKLVSSGTVENKATMVQGSISADGVYSSVVYSLEDAIVLQPDQNWLVEWKMTGPAADASGYKKILAQYVTRAEGDVSLMVHGKGQIVFGHYLSSHSQYGVIGQDVANTHVYRLVNRIDEGGINMPYLYVDGVEVGPMNMIPSGEDTDNWAEGRELVFSSIGQTNYPISALNIEYIYVKESGATVDMHIHSWGDWEVTTEPTLETVGEETRECATCDEVETREVPKLVKDVVYRWELEGTELVSKGIVKNELTKTTGSIGSDGTTKEVQYMMDTPILLEQTKDWAVEWKMSGTTTTWQKILALNGTRQAGDISIMLMDNTSPILAIGHYTTYGSSTTHLNYGTNELASSGIDMALEHTYRLENRINEDSSNTVYLLIDGKEIGPMDYSYKTTSTDNWVNEQDFVFAAIGQTNYPLKGAKIQYIEARLSGASEVEEDNGINGTGIYRWDLQDDTLVSTGEERNTVTRDQGTTEDDLFLQTRFSIEKPIELKHDQAWTLEWEMTGDWAATNSKLKKLFSEDGKKATTGAEAIMFSSADRLLSFGYFNGSTHLRIGATVPETIDLNEYHKYQLVNRVNKETGANMIYLLIDDVEIGAMNTPNKDGISEDWIVGNDFTFGFFGANEEYFLDGGIIRYIAVDEARKSESDEEEGGTEEPAEVRIKYRWELNADKNELVSVTPFGYTENALTDKAGSITGGVTKNLQYKFTTPVVLDHTKPWTVEWNMSGTTGSWQKVLVAQAKALVKTDYCIMLKNETLSMGKYVDGHVNYSGPSAVANAGISLADQHTYKLENRINADNTNTVYLWVDNVEYGPMSGSATATWLSTDDITFNYIGQLKNGSTSYALNGATINYIDIDLANAPEAEPEVPDVSGTWYRWELNEAKTELVPYTDRGYTENALTDKVGSITDGVTKNLQYKFTTPIVLDHTKPWTVEWDMTRGTNTSWQKILAGQAVALDGTENCLMVQNTNTISLSQYTRTNSHNNYSCGEMSSTEISIVDQHKYKLENRINADNTNTIYLWIDDVEIGAVDNHGSTTKPEWIVGSDLTFKYIGQQKNADGKYYGLTGATINYIDIYLGDAPVEEPDDVFVNERYRWDFENNALVSTGRVTNDLTTLKAGTITDGFFNGVQYGLAKPIRLMPTEQWIVEWTMTLSESAGGSYSKLMTLSQGRENGDISISVNNSNLVLIYDDGAHTQYGANEFDKTVLTGEHTYRLQNAIEGNTNMVYLYVDNKLVGPIDHKLGASGVNTFISGKPIILGFFGQAKYPMNNVSLDNIRVQERLVDCTHSWSEWVETLPTAAGNGKKERTCSVCGEVETVAVPGAWTVVSGFATRMQTYTGPKYKEVNLWDELKIVDGYYSGSNWVSKYQSINFYIDGGEEIYATAFGKAPDNGSASTNGIVVTFFDVYGNATKYSAAQVDEMFSANGFIKAPDDAIAVSVVQWKEEGSEVYIKNWPHGIHSYDEGVVTTEPTCKDKGVKIVTCTVEGCGHSYTEDVPVTDVHDWMDATFEAPKTCKVCGATEGEAKVAVAKIGEERYETLPEAVAAAQAGDTIVLLTDTELTERLTVSKQITLDLNGKTVTADFTDDFGAIYIGTKGDLTVTGNGTVISKQDIVFANYGKITVENGTFKSEGETYNAALYNMYNNGATYGTAVINGGTFQSEVWSSGVLTVVNGTLNGIDNSGVLTITGGIVNGTIIAGDGSDAPELANKGTIQISGGTFENAVEKAWCVEGYGPDIEAEDGYYGVHQHNYQATITAPTCTAAGYTTHTCSVCGDTYVDNYVDAKDHTYTSEETKAPTCTEAGVKTFTCACGDTYTEEIVATGHKNTTEHGRVDPTYDEVGYTAGTYCEDCQTWIEGHEEIPMLTGVEVNVDVRTNDLENGPQVTLLSGTTAGEGWDKEGTVIAGETVDFSVTFDKACVVIAAIPGTDGTITYTKVPAIATEEENTYNFSVNTVSGMEIIVAVKGDLTGDGDITSTDAFQMQRAEVGLRELTEVQRYASDINNDNEVTSTDAFQVQRAEVGLSTFKWN